MMDLYGIWGGSRPLLARWTTEFDCGYETEWYYCIKDTPFIIEQIRSKYRCEIRRGQRNFEIRKIDPGAYVREIWNIQTEAFSVYPNAYKPILDYAKLESEIKSGWGGRICFGAFDKITGEMVSYSTFLRNGEAISFSALKSIPRYERDRVNAAIVAYSLEYFNDEIAKGSYICDGERNISHQTNFQSYLERTFGFRKAYCKVHIVYRPGIKIVINILYPFRNILSKIHGKLLHNVNAVLKMEVICRRQNAQNSIIKRKDYLK